MTPPRYLRPPGFVPSRPRVRVMGPVSLVIAASTLFCVTCLFYLWQDAQITTGTARVAHLQQELLAANQARQTLVIQAERLQSQSRIEAEATHKYGMQQEDHVQWVPISILTPVLSQPLAAHHGRPPMAVAALRPHGLAAGWWQQAGHALAALFR